MKRETFEEMVQDALNGLASNMVEGTTASRKRKSHKASIGGVCYGNTEKLVGQAVARLATCGRTNKPIIVPTPDMVPPCF